MRRWTHHLRVGNENTLNWGCLLLCGVRSAERVRANSFYRCHHANSSHKNEPHKTAYTRHKNRSYRCEKRQKLHECTKMIDFTTVFSARLSYSVSCWIEGNISALPSSKSVNLPWQRGRIYCTICARGGGRMQLLLGVRVLRPRHRWRSLLCKCIFRVIKLH